jgi:nucleotide-binding universal stress UspA family protein
MIELKRILFPTDFSSNSKFARDYALGFAEHFHSELHVLHVLQDVMLYTAAPNATYAMPPSYLDELKASAERSLEQTIDADWAKERAVVRATRFGAPFVEIIRYAKEQDIDLIVLGTHGRTGLKHVLLGSVAENVVRKASCPVLTIRPSDHKFVMP